MFVDINTMSIFVAGQCNFFKQYYGQPHNFWKGDY